MDGGRKGRASEEVWKTWSECFQGKTSLTRGGLADAVAVQCSDSSVFMFYCKSWLSEWETFRWLWCGYVTVYAVFVFCFFFFVPVSTPWGCGIRGCVCVHPVSRGLTVNWMEKQIRSGVRFRVRPAAAAISSPRRHVKSKTDKKPRFIPVRKKKKNPDLSLCRRRRGKPCKLHGTHFFFFFPQVSRTSGKFTNKQGWKKVWSCSSHLICHVDSLTRVVSNLWATSANPTSGWSSAFLSGERRQRWREEGKEVRSDLAPLEEQRGTHSSALSVIINNLF